MTEHLSTNRTDRPGFHAVTGALVELGPRLRELGHAHARLDANARYLIAETVLDALDYDALQERCKRLEATLEAVGLDGRSGWLPLAAEAVNAVLVMAKDQKPMLGLIADMAIWRDAAIELLPQKLEEET